MRAFSVVTIFVFLMFGWSVPATAVQGPMEDGGGIDFSRDVLPILSNNCFQCHGPDEQTRAADLRLDLKDSMFGDLGGYAAFVPGKPDESVALDRIFSDDEDEVMPPSSAHLDLTEKTKTGLERMG